MKRYKLSNRPEVLDDADMVTIPSHRCSLQLGEPFVDAEVDCVPYDGCEGFVPSFTNACAGYSILERDEAADMVAYLWYEKWVLAHGKQEEQG
jgi:hypothetical protein